MTLEAVKMETVLHSPRAERISSILLPVSTHVDAKDLLVELELARTGGCQGIQKQRTSILGRGDGRRGQSRDEGLSDLPLSEAQRADILVMRKDAPSSSPEPSYVARPLNGVWATAPYLHNGSVPSLYDLLSPAAERPKSFCVGAREFGPMKVGLDQSSLYVRDESLFSTTGPDGAFSPGNSNLGYSLEGPGGGYAPRVIGRALREDERFDLIEYLKTL